MELLTTILKLINEYGVLPVSLLAIWYLKELYNKEKQTSANLYDARIKNYDERIEDMKKHGEEMKVMTQVTTQAMIEMKQAMTQLKEVLQFAPYPHEIKPKD